MTFRPLRLFLPLSVSHSPVPFTLSTVSTCPVWCSALQGSGGGKMTMLFYVNPQLYSMCTKLSTITLWENLLQSPQNSLIAPKIILKETSREEWKQTIYSYRDALLARVEAMGRLYVWESVCMCVCALLCTEQMRNPKWDLYTLLTMNLFFPQLLWCQGRKHWFI